MAWWSTFIFKSVFMQHLYFCNSLRCWHGIKIYTRSLSFIRWVNSARPDSFKSTFTASLAVKPYADAWLGHAPVQGFSTFLNPFNTCKYDDPFNEYRGKYLHVFSCMQNHLYIEKHWIVKTSLSFIKNMWKIYLYLPNIRDFISIKK